MQQNYIEQRLGQVIDGTGKDFEKIQRQAASLKQLGYDTYMIFVNTSEEVAQERNQARGGPEFGTTATTFQTTKNCCYHDSYSSMLQVNGGSKVLEHFCFFFGQD